MKLNKLLTVILATAVFAHATPANAFTDAAIELAKKWVLENGEAIARGVFRAVVGHVASKNTEDQKFIDGIKEIEGIEGFNERIDSFCAKGGGGFEGCKDLVTGGATVRSCGGKFCGADPQVALLIEQKCGLLSPRNLMKVAEFETSVCASSAWGQLRSNPDVLNKAIGGSQNGSVDNVFKFKKAILIGLMEVFEPNIVGAAEGYNTDDVVNRKLKEYLENDKRGIINEAVKQLADMASNRVAYREALANPEKFAKDVATKANAAFLKSNITAKAGVTIGPVGPGQKIGSGVTESNIGAIKSKTASKPVASLGSSGKTKK